MKKQTFELRRVNGASEVVEFTTLVVEAGGKVHFLALHRNGNGGWAVSEPTSGAAVIRHVAGMIRGKSLFTLQHPCAALRRLAKAEVEALIRRIGADEFNAVLANPPRA